MERVWQSRGDSAHRLDEIGIDLASDARPHLLVQNFQRVTDPLVPQLL